MSRNSIADKSHETLRGPTPVAPPVSTGEGGREVAPRRARDEVPGLGGDVLDGGDDLVEAAAAGDLLASWRRSRSARVTAVLRRRDGR
jgi:hypothetical protein